MVISLELNNIMIVILGWCISFIVHMRNIEQATAHQMMNQLILQLVDPYIYATLIC